MLIMKFVSAKVQHFEVKSLVWMGSDCSLRSISMKVLSHPGHLSVEVKKAS